MYLELPSHGIGKPPQSIRSSLSDTWRGKVVAIRAPFLHLHVLGFPCFVDGLQLMVPTQGTRLRDHLTELAFDIVNQLIWIGHHGLQA